MKKIIVLLGCSLFAYAGTAAAGGGCNYGKHANAGPVVEGEAKTTDPKLLALLKKDEAVDQAKEVLQPVHN